MAIPSFKNFIKSQNFNRKLELAATLIESRRFPLQLFSNWYLNEGIYRSKELLTEDWKDFWGHVGRGAAYGGAGSAAAGGADLGLGAAAGAGLGALHYGAKKVFGDDWGKSWNNWWNTSSQDQLKAKYATSKQDAIKILKELQKMSAELRNANLTDDNFNDIIDNLIAALQGMKPVNTPTTPTPQKPQPKTPPTKVDPDELNKILDDPALITQVENYINNDKFIKDIIEVGKELEKMGLNHYAINKNDIIEAVASYAHANNESIADAIKDFTKKLAPIDENNTHYKSITQKLGDEEKAYTLIISYIIKKIKDHPNYLGQFDVAAKELDDLVTPAIPY